MVLNVCFKVLLYKGGRSGFMPFYCFGAPSPFLPKKVCSTSKSLVVFLCSSSVEYLILGQASRSIKNDLRKKKITYYSRKNTLNTYEKYIIKSFWFSFHFFKFFFCKMLWIPFIPYTIITGASTLSSEKALQSGTNPLIFFGW